MANRRATIIIDAETQQARKAVRNVGTELERLEGWSREARSSVQRLADASAGMNAVERHARQSAGAVDRLAQEASESSGALQQMDQSMDVTGRRGGRFNNVIFSAGQAVEDFSFAGVRGAANNLSFMATELVNTSQQAGGFSKTLAGVGAALIGPAGIISRRALLPNFMLYIREATQHAPGEKGRKKSRQSRD